MKMIVNILSFCFAVVILVIMAPSCYSLLLNLDNKISPANLDTIVEKEKVEEYTIYSLNDSTNIQGKISGNAYCIRGNINNIDVYKILVQKEDYLTTITIPVNMTKVYEADIESEPRLESYNSEVEGRYMPNNTVISYKLYLPKNSISSDIAIDLKE